MKLIKKYWLLIIPLFLIIPLLMIVWLYSLYRREHGLYEKTLKNNKELVQQMRDIKQKDESISQAMNQMSSSQVQRENMPARFVDQKAYYREHWDNFIHINTNNYKTGLLGGIKNLKVEVSNQTDFKLDNIETTVIYKRANGEVFKKENVTINNIPSKGKASAAAPDSRAGSSVDIKLSKITSQDMNFCWTIDKADLPRASDPFACVPTR